MAYRAKTDIKVMSTGQHWARGASIGDLEIPPDILENLVAEGAVEYIEQSRLVEATKGAFELAEKLGINISNSFKSGTGEDGVVTKDDVAQFAKSIEKEPTEQPNATGGAIELAEQSNIDLSVVVGTGKDGRIEKGDVASHIIALEAEEAEDGDSA